MIDAENNGGRGGGGNIKYVVRGINNIVKSIENIFYSSFGKKKRGNESE